MASADRACVSTDTPSRRPRPPSRRPDDPSTAGRRPPSTPPASGRAPAPVQPGGVRCPLVQDLSSATALASASSGDGSGHSGTRCPSHPRGRCEGGDKCRPSRQPTASSVGTSDSSRARGQFWRYSRIRGFTVAAVGVCCDLETGDCSLDVVAAGRTGRLAVHMAIRDVALRSVISPSRTPPRSRHGALAALRGPGETPWRSPNLVVDDDDG